MSGDERDDLELVGQVPDGRAADEPPAPDAAPAVPRHILPGRPLTDEPKPCRYCHALIIWGVTVNDKRAPFNAAAPHVNHWTTCSGRGQARKDFPR